MPRKCPMFPEDLDLGEGVTIEDAGTPDPEVDELTFPGVLLLDEVIEIDPTRQFRRADRVKKQRPKAPDGSDFRGKVRMINDLPPTAEVASSAQMYEYDVRYGKMMKRRKRLFNTFTKVGKLRITGIVQYIPSYGALDYSNPYATEYESTKYICDCDCGRIGIVRPYYYLYSRAENASCGEGECKVPTRHKHAERFEGRTMGRLRIIRWVQGEGWECECELCGEKEFVRYSHLLYTACKPKRCEKFKPKPKRVVRSKAVRARLDGRSLRHMTWKSKPKQTDG